jgi:hypothetical protein
MKCSNSDCNRGIGLVSYRRGWSSRRRYCSKKCRDNFVAKQTRTSMPEWRPITYFDWLISRPVVVNEPRLAPAVVRVVRR